MSTRPDVNVEPFANGKYANRPQRRASAASSSLVPTPVGQTDRFDARRNGSVLAYLAAARRGPHDVSGVTCWRAIRLRRIHPNTAVERESDREADGCAERAPGENADDAADQEGRRGHELKSEEHFGLFRGLDPARGAKARDRQNHSNHGRHEDGIDACPRVTHEESGRHRLAKPAAIRPTRSERTTTAPEIPMPIRTRRRPTIQGRRASSGIAKAIPLVSRIVTGPVRAWAPRSAPATDNPPSAATRTSISCVLPLIATSSVTKYRVRSECAW